MYWPRLIAGVAVILAVEWEPLARIAAPVFDSPLLALPVLGLLMAGVVEFGRPWTEFELRDEGVLRHEGLIFSILRRASWMPWGAIAGLEMNEEMDGSRSLTLRTRHGATWKLWEKYGTGDDFDAIHPEFASRLERRPATSEGSATMAIHWVWDGVAARVVVAVPAAGWRWRC